MNQIDSSLGDAQSQVTHDQFVEEVRNELSEIDESSLSEHSARFESLHVKLQQALNSIDGL